MRLCACVCVCVCVCVCARKVWCNMCSKNSNSMYTCTLVCGCTPHNRLFSKGFTLEEHRSYENKPLQNKLTWLNRHGY